MRAHPGIPPSDLLDKFRIDQAILEVFLFVLIRRLTVIDDLEFKGVKRSCQTTPFLSLELSQFIADLLNRGLAYRIFQNETTMQYFEPRLLESLKSCIQRLYERDKRLKLYPPNFWIVDKKAAERVDQLNLNSVVKTINLTLL